jgi:hypothetical protein
MLYKPYTDNSATHKLVAQYILPYLMGLIALLIIGELAGQFFTLDQLQKTSGTITDVRTAVVSHTRNRTVAPSRANYALIVTLNNGSSYAMQDTTARTTLAPILHAGDNVTIYYPSLLYTIVNTGLVKPVEQLELDKKVVYSFDDEKKGNYVIIGFLTALLVVTYFWRRSWIKGDY